MCKYPGSQASWSRQTGRPDDGTDPTGFYNSEFFVPLKPHDEWPAGQGRSTGWRAWLGPMRPRTKDELIEEMNDELNRDIVGVNWNFSQNIRDNVMEVALGREGRQLGQDHRPRPGRAGESWPNKLTTVLEGIHGIKNVGIFRVKGQPNLEIPGRSAEVRHWGVSVADVEDVVQTAVGGKPFSQMIEGEKRFDITLRWPEQLRSSEQAILNIPVDVSNNQVTGGSGQRGAEPMSPARRPGCRHAAPASPCRPYRQRVRRHVQQHLDQPRAAGWATWSLRSTTSGKLDPNGHFIRSGASTIYREQGNRLIAVKFSVRDRDLAGAVAEAQAKTSDLFQAPYRAEWSGEFQEMQEAEHRLMFIIPLSLSLIFVLLYLAFRSLLDAFCRACPTSSTLSMGGIWALLLTGTHFSISAAVGFISLFGVAIMDGLLMISYFNQLRGHGHAAARRHHARGRKAGAARDDDRADGHLRPAAGRLVHAHRRPDPAAAGHRRRGRHDHHAVPDALSDARAVQLLRPSRALGRSRPAWRTNAIEEFGRRCWPGWPRHVKRAWVAQRQEALFAAGRISRALLDAESIDTLSRRNRAKSVRRLLGLRRSGLAPRVSGPSARPSASQFPNASGAVRLKEVDARPWRACARLRWIRCKDNCCWPLHACWIRISAAPWCC